jgi:hypothetical protein
MITYNPNEELTTNELNALDEKDFFEYLDLKAKHLKQFTKPLSEHHTKHYSAMSAAISGNEFTEEHYKTAKEIAKQNNYGI